MATLQQLLEEYRTTKATGQQHYYEIPNKVYSIKPINYLKPEYKADLKALAETLNSCNEEDADLLTRYISQCKFTPLDFSEIVIGPLIEKHPTLARALYDAYIRHEWIFDLLAENDLNRIMHFLPVSWFGESDINLLLAKALTDYDGTNSTLKETLLKSELASPILLRTNQAIYKLNQDQLFGENFESYIQQGISEEILLCFAYKNNKTNVLNWSLGPNLTDEGYFNASIEEDYFYLAKTILEANKQPLGMSEANKKKIQRNILEAISQSINGTVRILLAVNQDWDKPFLDELKLALAKHCFHLDGINIIKLFVPEKISFSELITSIENHNYDPLNHEELDFMDYFIENIFSTVKTNDDISVLLKHLNAVFDRKEDKGWFVEVLLNSDIDREVALQTFHQLSPEAQEYYIIHYFERCLENDDQKQLETLFKNITTLGLSQLTIDKLYTSLSILPEQRETINALFNQNAPPSTIALETKRKINTLLDTELTNEAIDKYLQEGFDANNLLITEIIAGRPNDIATLVKRKGLFSENELRKAFEFASEGKSETLKAFIKNAPMAWINKPNQEDLTLIAHLILQTSFKDPTIKTLLESDVDLNINYVIVREHFIESLLSYCIKNNMSDFSELILKRNDVDVSVPDNKPFEYALDSGNYKLAALIYEKSKEKPPIPPELIQTLNDNLIPAIQEGNAELVKALITLGADWSEPYLLPFEAAVKTWLKSPENNQNLIRVFVPGLMPFSAFMEHAVAFLEQVNIKEPGISNPVIYDLLDTVTTEADINAFAKNIEGVLTFDPAQVKHVLPLFNKEYKVGINIFNQLPDELQKHILEYYFSSSPEGALEEDFFKRLPELQIKQSVIDRAYGVIDNAYIKGIGPKKIHGEYSLLNDKVMATIEVMQISDENRLNEEALDEYLGKGIYLNELLQSSLSANRIEQVDLILKHKELLTAEELASFSKRAIHDNAPILDVLIKHEIPFNWVDKSKHFHNLNVLFILEFRSDYETMNKLLDSDIDLNINYVFESSLNQEYDLYKGESILSFTINNTLPDDPIIQRLLARKDIDVTIPDHKSFKYAIKDGKYELAALIYEKSKEKPEIPPESARELQAALQSAVQSRDATMVHNLLAIGVDWKEAFKLAFAPFNSAMLKEFVPKFASFSDLIKNVNLISFHKIPAIFDLFDTAKENEVADAAQLLIQHAKAGGEIKHNLFRGIAYDLFEPKTQELALKLFNTLPKTMQMQIIIAYIYPRDVEIETLLELNIDYRVIEEACIRAEQVDLMNLSNTGEHTVDALKELSREGLTNERIDYWIKQGIYVDTLFYEACRPLKAQEIEHLLNKSIISQDELEQALNGSIGKHNLSRLVYPHVENKHGYYYQKINDELIDKIISANDEVLKSFLEQAVGIDWHCESRYYENTPLTEVINLNNDEITAIVIEQGISRAELFNLAVNDSKWEFIKGLLKNGFNPETLDCQRALLKSIDTGEKETAILLLDHISGAFNQSEALVRAVHTTHPNVAIVEALLDCEADYKVKGCMLPLEAMREYYDLQNPEYIKIAKEMTQKIAPQNAIINNLFDDYIQGNMSFGDLNDILTDVIKDTLSPSQLIAFEMLLIKKEFEHRMGEYAGTTALTSKAEKQFVEVVQPALAQRFSQKPGADDMQKVEAIEKEIKAFLLEEIVRNCKADERNQFQQLLEFVEQNKEELIQGKKPELLAQMRQLVDSTEYAAQIAWRGYDKDAHSIGYANLLTPGDPYSNQVRLRIAYYFLEIANLNKDNFLEQLADIRRAHSTLKGIDAPSCYPGTVGRIGKMGAGHPGFQLPPEKQEIIQQQISALVLKTFTEQIQRMDLAKAQELFAALVMLTTTNAEEIISEKVPYDEDWVPIRQTFIKSLGTRDEITQKINGALTASGESELDKSDEIHLRRELTDIATSGRAMELGKRLRQKQEPEKPTATVVEAISNPYTITPAVIGMLPPDRKRKLVEQKLESFITFEILLAACPHLAIPTERKSDLIREIVYQFLSSNAKTPSEKMNLAFEKADFDFENIEKDPLKDAFTKALESDLSEQQINEINEKIEKQLYNKDNSVFNDMIQRTSDRLMEPKQTAPKSKPSLGL